MVKQDTIDAYAATRKQDPDLQTTIHSIILKMQDMTKNKSLVRLLNDNGNDDKTLAIIVIKIEKSEFQKPKEQSKK